MTDAETTPALEPATEERGSFRRVPRTRGLVSGVLLILAGIWGAFVPFVGPYFHFAYTPKPGQTWHWTAARGWYEVLPGGLAVLGGLLLVVSASRIITITGAWLAALAGGWFVVGQQVSLLLTLGSPGTPAARGDRRYVAEYLAFFTGLGAVIILFAAVALGRLSVRSVRDARAAARRDDEVALAEQQAAEQDDLERADYDRAAADRGVADRNADAWAAGEREGGYGTPADPAPVSPEPAVPEPAVPELAVPEPAHPVESYPASAVTSELPVAADERDGSDEHAAFRPAPEDPAPRSRDEDERRQAGPDDDTAALPVVPESRAPEPSGPEPSMPETSAPVPSMPESNAPEPNVSEANAAPLVLEPPEGHPDAPRPRAAAAPASEPAEPGAGAEPSPATWNPEAQSPTTTGELPALGTTRPPAEPTPTRRGIQQPRRYFGAGNPVPSDEAPAAEAPAAEAPASEAPTSEAPAAPPRDAVRTDESIDQDLDHEMDLDERTR